MPIILHSGPPVPLMPFDERVRRSRMEGCLVILPTKRRVRHLTRDIMRLSPGAVAPALALHTLESFCRAMFAAGPAARPVVAGAAKTLLFQEASREIAPSLRYFAPRGGSARLPRGTLDRLVDVIVHLKETGVYPGRLEEELAQADPGEQQKLRDVAAVYAAYESRLGSRHLEDLEGVYRSLDSGCTMPQFTALFRRLFPEVEAVSLAGFDEFTHPEMGVLRKLSLVDGLSVTVMFDFLRENPDLFGHLEENYSQFIAFGFREARGKEEAASAAFFFGAASRPPPVRAATDHLARTLFRRSPGGPSEDLTSLVTVFSGRNRTQEAELICKLIKRLCAERPGRDLSSICVALHRPQVYTDIMREQFARHDIPVNITDRFALSRSPLVVGLLGLLAIPLRGFRREDVGRALTSPFIVLPGERGPVDGANLLEVSRRLRIVGGAGTWRETIERALRRTEDLPSPEEERAPSGSDPQRDSLQRAKGDFGVLERLLRPLSDPCTPAQFAQRFQTLWTTIGLPERLVDTEVHVHPELAERDIRAFTAFQKVVDDIASVAATHEEGGVRQPLRVHYDGLIAALGRERYNVRERFGRGVLVTSIDETRELPIEVMIVAGLVEGEFPSPYLPEVFFSARRGRAREQKHIWENRYLFYQAATNWTEQLFLTYPETEGDVELVRSTFVDSLFSVAKVRVWDRETPAPFAGDIASRSEFLRDYGSQVAQSPSPPSPPAGLEKECEGVAEGVRVERSRMIGHDRPEYEGRIATALSPADADRLARLRHGVYSVSQLESYAGCPFQFFAKNLLRLQETREFEEEITAGEKGSVLHDILFEFFRSRRERGAPALRGSAAGDFEEAVAEAVRIASTRLERLEMSDVFWEMEKEWILGSGPRPGLLRRILEFERDRIEPVRPAFFEATFGSPPSRDERSDPLLGSAEPVMLGGVALRGRVDRVDIGDGFFSVLDYKTGSTVPGLREIRDGSSLQIPVYLHAVEQMLRARGETDLVPAGGFYLRLRDDVDMRPAVAAKTYQGRAFPAGARHRQFVADETELRGIMEGTREAVEACVGGIAEGRFPLTTADRVDRLCGHCPFRTMCRIQTLRHVKSEPTEEA